MEAKYKAGIIGCGRMAKEHIKAYQELGIPIVAVADISKEVLEKVKKDLGIGNTYIDYIKMLNDIKPDIVSIVTPESSHCEIVVNSAKEGVKGILCEKPMAMNLKEAKIMIEACYNSNSKLVINHQRHYSPQYMKAREVISQGYIGKIRFVEAFAFYPSVFTDGTHTIHMIFSLLGNSKPSYLIAQIDGNSDYCYYGHRCDHAGIAFIAFEDKTYAYFTWGGLVPYPPIKERLHPLWDFDKHRYHTFIVYGDLGRLELYGDFTEKDTLDKIPPILYLIRGESVEQINFEWPVKRHPITLVIEDLIKSIEFDIPHPLSGENGYIVTETIMGIYESSRRRGIVRFPVEVEDNPFLSMCEEGIFPK